jgi:membrane protease YdiL (CAAX protease family)
MEKQEKSIRSIPYLTGLLAIFAFAYSQYFVRGFGLVFGAIIVYGIPVLIVSVIWGRSIIKRAFNNTYVALKFGLGFFGAFTVLGILVAVIILVVMLLSDPTTANLLQKPNPVLNIPPEFAWIMVWFSVLVVGPAEEYLFRGFMYGGLLNLFRGRRWLSLAFLSSILFAAVHPYYAFTYGVASSVPYVELITFGIAMAATYYVSGGNLLLPALIHGTYDATGFIGVAVSRNVGIELRGLMIMIGIIAAIALFIQRTQRKEIQHL